MINKVKFFARIKKTTMNRGTIINVSRDDIFDNTGTQRGGKTRFKTELKRTSVKI